MTECNMRIRLLDVTCCSCDMNHIVLDPAGLKMECSCGKKWKIESIN